MENRAFINQDGVIEQIYVGDQTAGSLVAITAVLKQLSRQLRQQSRPVQVLVNLSGIGHVSAGARKAGLKTVQDLDYDQAAIYGASVFTKGLANLVITAAGKGHQIKLLNNRRQARAWLKEVLNDG